MNCSKCNNRDGPSGVTVVAACLRDASNSRQSCFAQVRYWKICFFNKLRAVIDNQSDPKSWWPKERKPKSFLQSLVVNALQGSAKPVVCEWPDGRENMPSPSMWVKSLGALRSRVLPLFLSVGWSLRRGESVTNISFVWQTRSTLQILKRVDRSPQWGTRWREMCPMRETASQIIPKWFQKIILRLSFIVRRKTHGTGTGGPTSRGKVWEQERVRAGRVRGFLWVHKIKL